jgi:integrase
MQTLTVDALCAAYLKDRANPHAERVCKNPKSLAYHLKASRALWGDMAVRDFAEGSRARVKAQCQVWRGEGLSPYTVRKRVSLLKTVFRFAVNEEIIQRAEEPVILLPVNGAARERFLDEETELPLLLAAIDDVRTPDHLRLLLQLALRTGQRRGAILALRWEHIDFERRVIRFRDTEAAAERSKKRRGNKPMDDELYDLLRRAREASEEGCDFVIQWRGAQVRNPYHGLKAVYDRAGLKNVRTHDMRRSSATYVHTETQGDLTAAANHIVDTEQTARRHYVQEDPRVHMPAITAVSSVMARAKARLAKARQLGAGDELSRAP